jgi:high-affinity Fe2+/Pb2+ permease
MMNKSKDMLPQIVTGVMVALIVSSVIGIFNYWLQVPLLMVSS